MSSVKLVIPKETSKTINPDMVGLFFEDINFAADGGLYAELLENRSFEAIKSQGEGHNYVLREDGIYAWSSTCGKQDNLIISCNQPVSESNPHYLRFIADNGEEGFSNKAYDGLTLKKDAEYRISFYAREVSYPEGKIKVNISKDGKVIDSVSIDFENGKNPPSEWYDTIVVKCDTKDWKKYETTLRASQDVKGATFDILLTNAGTVEFDLISMMPSDAVAGVFRKDLFEALYNLHPGFLRFPGGCIVEGTSIKNRYRWKNTVGELKDRKICPNLWALQGGNCMSDWETPDSHYMQSYGIGFYEYFLLCELLSTENRRCIPLPVLNIGVACQFRSYETVPIESEEFDQYIQDALDLIQFANGPVGSKWGALRAKMGHPESFNLDFLAIGNEQWESNAVDLAPRYIAFEKAIHEKYPEMKLLGTAGPFVKHELHSQAWDFYRDNCNEANPVFTYAVDEHYYVAPQWLYDNVDFYNDYPRDIKVFAGEYAAHDANQSNSVEAGLAEAAMMTGMERNGDVVWLASYAPLFNRIGHAQWTPDMIWFDEDSVVLTPSYYVQKAFSDYAGEEVYDLGEALNALKEKGVYASCVKRGEKTILKLVNSSKEAVAIDLFNALGEKLCGAIELTQMKAKSGMPKVPVKTEAIGPDEGNKAIHVKDMSNRRLCELRGPEEVIYETKTVEIQGEINLVPGSLTVLCI